MLQLTDMNEKAIQLVTSAHLAEPSPALGYLRYANATRHAALYSGPSTNNTHKLVRAPPLFLFCFCSSAGFFQTGSTSTPVQACAPRFAALLVLKRPKFRTGIEKKRKTTPPQMQLLCAMIGWRGARAHPQRQRQRQCCSLHSSTRCSPLSLLVQSMRHRRPDAQC